MQCVDAGSPAHNRVVNRNIGLEGARAMGFTTSTLLTIGAK